MTDTVTLAFTAHARNVGLARSTAAAMAARADLPIDQLEDVRLAVDEAVSMALVEAPDDGLITCVFDVDGTTLGIRVSAPSRSGREPARDTFSWTVLTALVDSVTVSTEEDSVTLTLRIARRAPAEA